MSEEFVLTNSFLIGINQIDYAGVMFNKCPIEFADEMRLLWFNKFMSNYKEIVHETSIVGLVGSNSVKYHAPLYMGDSTVVKTSIHDINNHFVTFMHKGNKDDQLCFSVKQKLVFFDNESQQRVGVSDYITSIKSVATPGNLKKGIAYLTQELNRAL